MQGVVPAVMLFSAVNVAHLHDLTCQRGRTCNHDDRAREVVMTGQIVATNERS